VWVLFIPSALSGLTGGAIGPLIRARWGYVVTTPRQLHTAYSLESALDELTFIVGPVLATALATGVTPSAGLIAPIILAAGGALALFSQRATEPPVLPHPEPSTPGTPTRTRPALFITGVPVIAGIFIALGCTFGAIDITVVASCEAWGNTGASGIVLGAFSLGSMLSGLTYGARAWVAPLWRRFVLVILALTLTGTLLAANSIPELGIWGFVVGLAVAPTLINGNALVQHLVPPEQLTEGLTWIGTALGVGVSIGSTVGGQAVDRFGAHYGFVVVCCVASAAIITALLATPTLRRATGRIPNIPDGFEH
jgi:MFS family permease